MVYIINQAVLFGGIKMIKPEFQTGDIFFVDSNKFGARIVKMFQTAPTWIQHLWRKFRGTQEKVLYFHVGMFSDAHNLIEQQGKVIVRTANKLLNTNNEVLVVRKKSLVKIERSHLLKVAMEDLGEGYDVVNCIGKFLTWLTGIPLFAMYMQMPNQDICINRIAYWYKKAFDIKFGAKTHSELTTHTLYKYIMAHPEDWEIVYRGIPREDKLV